MSACCLGIDTSCYRTSVALANPEGFEQQRKLLLVSEGKRGLMQNEMVFQHAMNLPALIEELLGMNKQIDCVSVSGRPRPVEGSYMPTFILGEGTARSLAAALHVPLSITTHQQGHLRAAMVSELPGSDRFLAIHLSGGTTEVLLADKALNVELISGTSDLPAGQLVDRIGVALGCPFPAGPALEELAMGVNPKALIPTSMVGHNCSFSGAEAQLTRMIEAGTIDKKEIAAELYSFIARTLAKLIASASAQAGVSQALLFGGVAASSILRDMLPERLDRLRCKIEMLWASPALSGDNAVGVAYIGLDQLLSQGE